MGLSLADSDFGTPGAVDLLLGANIFSHVMLHGWQFGPSGSLSTFMTLFDSVLAGPGGSSSQSGSCYLSVEGRAQVDATHQRASCTSNGCAPWNRLPPDQDIPGSQVRLNAVRALAGDMLALKPFGMAGSK